MPIISCYRRGRDGGRGRDARGLLYWRGRLRGAVGNRRESAAGTKWWNGAGERRVVRGTGGWLFARKDVVLDSRQIDTLLAIPL